nr:unnamed protein product [Digitaria exilis]
MDSHATGIAGKRTAPYGSWESPISAAAVSAAGRTAEGLAVAGDGRLVWVETRPEEGGRAVLVKEPAESGGKARDVTPQGFAVDLQMKHEGFWILVCSTGQAEDGHLLMLTMGEAQIADLASLTAGMHKFEAYYIDNLVGNKQAYFERSPINFVDKFSCPVILFSRIGRHISALLTSLNLYDLQVVSPDQATKIYKAIKDKGLPVALVEYEGEQHGFRKAENIKFTLEQEMVFFARLVGKFKVADDITPIKIENFD